VNAMLILEYTCIILYLKIIKILYIHEIYTYIMLMYISQI
jgi:hypothetical protein